MAKRLFEILDEMNGNDIKNNTRMVEVSNTFLSGDKVKGGYKIGMGVPNNILGDLLHGNKIALLVVVDKEEYNKIKDENKSEETTEE